MDDPIKKAKWVEALRSGKHKQGRSVLRSFDNKYCCLAVGLEAVANIQPKRSYECSAYEYGTGFTAVLGEKLRAVLGISQYEESQAIKWNDCGKLTFAEIADLIEQTF